MRHATKGDNRDPRALVVPGEPVIHPEQARPPGLRVVRTGTGRHSVPINVIRDAVEGLVLLRRVVYPKHDDVRMSVARDVGDGHPAALVLPREPAGHITPV
jgi:hypothetical protein